MRKYLLGTLTFIFAFAILSISVLESSTPHYAFAAPSPTSTPVLNTPEMEIDYTLPYPGRVLPDSPFWPLKAFRDKLWLGITTNSLKEAELSLLFSDKRLAMSKTLFERQKPELAFSTLTKAEKYLEKAVKYEKKAREKGDNTSDLLVRIGKASLKHRQVIDEVLEMAPGDAKPGIIKTQEYSKNLYNNVRETLNSMGIEAPINPFDGEE